MSQSGKIPPLPMWGLVALGGAAGASLRHAGELIFPWEGAFAFSSIYGFVACVILVIVAKYVLRPMVMRDEDYYDD